MPGFLHPIEGRILMLSTGIRAQVGVKILGRRPRRAAEEGLRGRRSSSRQIPGAAGVAPRRIQGKPYLKIEVDRVAMARYGLRAQDVLDVVEAGLGGKNVTTTIEGRQRFPIQVRFQRDERERYRAPRGCAGVLARRARSSRSARWPRIKRVIGPSEITSENGRLRAFVQANVQGRDLGGFVKEARERIARELRLAPGHDHRMERPV